MSLKTNFFSRATAILLCFIILAVPMCSGVFAETAQTVKFTVDNISGDKGQTVNVPVKFSSNDGKMIELNGIMFTLSYDTSKLDYVASSTSNALKGLTAFDKNGKVSCAWFDVTSYYVSSGSTIAFISFRIKDEAEGDAAVTLTVDKIYKSAASGGTSNYVYYTCTTPTVKAKVSIGVDSAVQKVIDAIKAIGTVTNTEECYNKIVEATRLYGKLTVNQQAKVTNYNILLAAENTYNKLQAEESQKLIDEEVAKFKKDHAEALAVRLTEGDAELSLDKYDILKAAYDRFGTGNGKLSAGAQAELLVEYRRLGFYLEMLKDAKASYDEKQKLEQLKAWEKQLCRAYVAGGYEIDPLTGKYVTDSKGNKVWITGLTESSNEWIDILTMTKKNVTATDFTRINYFKTSWYDNMIALHPDIETIMNDEYDGLAKQIMEAYDRAKYLYDLDNPVLTPDQEAANSFRSKFSYVLGLNEKNATYDDLTQIEMALAVYEFMSAEAKELLAKEYALLQNLKSAASSKTPSSGGGDDITGPGTAVFDSSAEANSLYSAFSQTWANVFSMNPDDITAEDYSVLLAMITNYETLCSMNPEVAALLSEQMKAVYAMYDKASALYGDGSGSGSAGVIAGPAATGWDSNNVLNFMGREMGVIVWILLALLALSTTIFVVLRVFYHSLKKNKALFAEEVAI